MPVSYKRNIELGGIKLSLSASIIAAFEVLEAQYKLFFSNKSFSLGVSISGFRCTAVLALSVSKSSMLEVSQ